jgi:hypothetical protein
MNRRHSPSVERQLTSAQHHDGRGSNFDRALCRVLAEIQDGLRHGHFDFRLTSEVITQERRRFTLRAGKSHQFVIPKDECVSIVTIDPCGRGDAHDSNRDASDHQHDDHATGSVAPAGATRAPCHE